MNAQPRKDDGMGCCMLMLDFEFVVVVRNCTALASHSPTTSLPALPKMPDAPGENLVNWAAVRGILRHGKVFLPVFLPP